MTNASAALLKSAIDISVPALTKCATDILGDVRSNSFMASRHWLLTRVLTVAGINCEIELLSAPLQPSATEYFPSIVSDTSPGKNQIYRCVGKRALDVAITLVIILPVTLLLAVLVILARRDGGPGFYAQERVGLNGQTFKCLKLRTMAVDAEDRLKKLCEEDPAVALEWQKNQKLENDPRITRLGRILRATSLDELPQIYNVLLGQMSLVGPRPFLPSQNDLYWQAGGRAYYHCRPGITGPWQVEGRGQTSFLSRIEFDENYHSNLSFGGDIALMCKTVLVVLKRTGH
mgnify:FL=1